MNKTKADQSVKALFIICGIWVAISIGYLVLG